MLQWLARSIICSSRRARIVNVYVSADVPRRLPRDPPAADDGPAEVPPGEAGGAKGLLPAAQRHPGGALQEGCGE